jgi:tripartite-type tricarboxylate transporter receptor subunit TctC
MGLEAGIPGLALEAWNAVFTPSGTPQTIIARLNSEIDRALSDPAIRARMLAVDLPIVVALTL